jgi:preprotein translocase subunit SecD
VSLTDPGRRRIWQFSRRNPGAQLLFIVDGNAIAAPRIRHELSSSSIAITQIPDRGLVEDAVEQINTLRKPSS